MDLHYFIKKCIYILISIQLLSCTGPSVSLNIDLERWKEDHDGCKGYRMQVYRKVISNKEDLLGLSTKAIVKLLGNPFINELYQRNQKFFVYRITPSASCGKQAETEEIFLIFRFNAMGLANEIYINDIASPTD